jgi:hypothetical protein
MKQEFVYHALPRRESRPRQARVAAADATVAVKEYLTYIAMLSIAVVIAIITFTYAASMTVRWLDAAAKPGFLAQSQTVSPQADKLAMLPAVLPFKKAE